MGLDLKKFLSVAAVFGPQILALTPLAPIAPWVAKGIQSAAQLQGASNAEKLAHVKEIALEGAEATNAQAGRIVLDPTLVMQIGDTTISETYQVLKLIHGAGSVDQARAALVAAGTEHVLDLPASAPVPTPSAPPPPTPAPTNEALPPDVAPV